MPTSETPSTSVSLPARAPYTIVPYDERQWVLLRRARPKGGGALYYDRTNPLGYFASIEAAAKAYLEHATRHHTAEGQAILEAIRTARREVEELLS